MKAHTAAKPATAGAVPLVKAEVSIMERDVKMSRRQIEREIDIALAARIECEKKDQTVLAALHQARLEKLAAKLGEAELG